MDNCLAKKNSALLIQSSQKHSQFILTGPWKGSLLKKKDLYSNQIFMLKSVSIFCSKLVNMNWLYDIELVKIKDHSNQQLSRDRHSQKFSQGSFERAQL